MKANILFILHLPPPIHGAAMVGQYIKDSHLINSSFDCTYINLALAKDLNDIGKSGLKKFFSFFLKLWTIYKTVRRGKPALVYITPNAKGGAFYKDFTVVMLLKIMKQNIIAHYHNKGVSDRQNRSFDHFLYKKFFSDIKIILLSESLYIDFKKYVKPDNLFICPNGLPHSFVLPKQYEDDLAKPFSILFLSNMMADKGVWDLLNACVLLKNKGLQFKCNFVGKWSDISKAVFFEWLLKNDLDNYVFAYGPKYGEDKNNFFQDADLFVFPTYYHNESFPLVLLEAMEYSLPCVSTDEGGIPDIIDEGKNGLIVPKKSPEALASAIEQMINNRELCYSYGKAARKKFEENYTLEIFEQRINSILRTSIARPK